jgi:NCAIR mutase (PurE)-related protein
MLNSCAANVSVVNIDNGFSAGFSAALIARQSVRAAAGSAASPGADTP